MRLRTGRGRKGYPDGRTLGPTGIWSQVEGRKGGQLDGGRQAQYRARISFGAAGRGGDLRPAVADGGWGCCPGEQLLRNQSRCGEINGCKYREKRLQQVKMGGAIGDSPRGEDQMI